MEGPAKILLHLADSADTSGFFPELARWHDRRAYRMLFATLGVMEEELRAYMEGQGVRCFSFGCRRRADYPAGLVRLARYLREERVDILHTHLFDPSVVGLAAGTLARTPLRVLTRHYSDYHTRIHRRWHTRLDRLCTGLSHAVVAVSRHTAEHLVRVEGAPPSKVHVVLNGVQLERTCVNAGAAARVSNELAAGDKRLLTVPARLHPEKGHEHLFRALPALRRSSLAPFLVLIAGDGPSARDYRQMVSELGCSDVVRFLGFRRDLADLIAASYAVVLPSLAEAFGIVLVEALYIGAPVIATTAGGIPEIVDDGRDGLLVSPGDPAALEQALRKLLNDPSLRERLAGAGRERVAGRFSFERMVREYEALYETLARRRAA